MLFGKTGCASTRSHSRVRPQQCKLKCKSVSTSPLARPSGSNFCQRNSNPETMLPPSGKAALSSVAFFMRPTSHISACTPPFSETMSFAIKDPTREPSICAGWVSLARYLSLANSTRRGVVLQSPPSALFEEPSMRACFSACFVAAIFLPCFRRAAAEAAALIARAGTALKLAQKALSRCLKEPCTLRANPCRASPRVHLCETYATR